jgi:stage II sporulation protein D
VGRLFDVRVTKWSSGKRAQQVVLEGQAGSRYMTGAQFRSSLGAGWLKSLRFDVNKHGSGWKLMGQGWGHGVGMSQLGARAMALAGKDYKDILSFHYPFASIVTLSLNQAPGAVAANPPAPAVLAR